VLEKKRKNILLRENEKLPILYKCDDCKKIKHYSITDFVVGGFVRFAAFIGIFVLILCALAPSIPGIIMMEYTTARFTQMHNIELRDLARNFTTYDGDEPFMAADQIVKNMPRIRYVLPSLAEPIQDPIYTYEKGGDCKNSAILFSGMMMTLGYNSYPWCNLKYEHCVSKMVWGDQYMVVDLTSDDIFVFSKDVDYWEYAFNNNSSIEVGVPIWHKRYPKSNIPEINIEVEDGQKMS
jgi:hypothetical protein